MKINQGNFTTADLQGAPATFNNPEPIGDFQTSITLTQPIYSRRAILGVEMARAEAGAVNLDRERRREEIAHQVMQAWLGAKAAEAYLETAMRAEEDAAEHLRLANVAETAGTGLASDRLRAEVALAEARRMRLTVENDLEIARRGLGLAVGREEALAPAEAAPVIAPPDLETLIAGAGQSRRPAGDGGPGVKRPPCRETGRCRATPGVRSHGLAAGERPGRPVRHLGDQLHGWHRRDVADVRRFPHQERRGAG